MVEGKKKEFWNKNKKEKKEIKKKKNRWRKNQKGKGN